MNDLNRMVQLMAPRKKVTVKFDVDDESFHDSGLAPLHKRPKLDSSSLVNSFSFQTDFIVILIC